MKFLLVAPKQAPKGHAYGFPLGIAYISSMLKRAGYDVLCVNLNHTDDPEGEVERAVREFDPDVCGSGATSMYFGSVAMVFEVAKKTKPGLLCVAGGGLVSSAPERILDIIGADIGVIGEGELVIIDIARTLENDGDMADVQSIVFKDADGNLVRTPARKANKELDDLPWPDYEGFEIEQMLDTQNVSDEPFFHITDDPRCIPLISSRSCPFACTFCFHPSGRVYRVRSLDELFKELDFLIEKYNARMFDICDELFAVKRARLIEFCERITPYNINWTCQLHVSVVDDEVMALMKKSGCTLISYGLESASDDILTSMQKKTKVADYDRVLAITRKHGVGIQGNFIFGDPAETLGTANETLRWWAENRRYLVNLSLLQAYPGSAVYEEAARQGKINPQKEYLPQGLINLTKMSDRDMEKLRARVVAFRESMVVPAKVLSFEQQPEPDPYRGSLYHIEWECPHCRHQNAFNDVAVVMPFNFQTFRFACRSCLSRSDIQNFARPEVHDERADALFQEASTAMEQGHTDTAVAKYRQLISMDYKRFGNDRPESYIRACHELALYCMNQPGGASEATFLMSHAIFRRAYDPRYHMAYAITLLADNSPHAAALHCQTARRLVHEGNPAFDAAIDNLINTVDQETRATYSPTFF